jgi:hypothetical protein
MRQIADNKWMRISNGQSMEGDPVFPGIIPDGAYRVDVRFNLGAGSEVGHAVWENLPEAADSVGD